MWRFLKLVGAFVGLYVLLVLALQMRAPIGFDNPTLHANRRSCHLHAADLCHAYRELLGIAHQLPPEHILNFTSPEDFPDLYAQEQQFDLEHLNDEGSIRFTVELAQAVTRLFSGHTQNPSALEDDVDIAEPWSRVR